MTNHQESPKEANSSENDENEENISDEEATQVIPKKAQACGKSQQNVVNSSPEKNNSETATVPN